MIDVKELRIGNWVSFIDNQGETKFDCVVTILNEGSAYTRNYQFRHKDDDIKPIPLTPEILEQCGFEKKSGLDNKNGISPDYFEYEGLKLWDNNDEQTSWYHVNSELLIYIDYLHQLQNLYFALTGEELQLNIHDNIKNEI